MESLNLFESDINEVVKLAFSDTTQRAKLLSRLTLMIQDIIKRYFSVYQFYLSCPIDNLQSIYFEYDNTLRLEHEALSVVVKYDSQTHRLRISLNDSLKMTHISFNFQRNQWVDEFTESYVVPSKNGSKIIQMIRKRSSTFDPNVYCDLSIDNIHYAKLVLLNGYINQVSFCKEERWYNDIIISNTMPFIDAMAKMTIYNQINQDIKLVIEELSPMKIEIFPIYDTRISPHLVNYFTHPKLTENITIQTMIQWYGNIFHGSILSQ